MQHLVIRRRVMKASAMLRKTMVRMIARLGFARGWLVGAIAMSVDTLVAVVEETVGCFEGTVAGVSEGNDMIELCFIAEGASKAECNIEGKLDGVVDAVKVAVVNVKSSNTEDDTALEVGVRVGVM